MGDLFKNTPKWVKNSTELPKEYVDMVHDVIKKSARKEALEILELAPNEEREEFKKYYLEKNYNICCCCLDTFKYILVKNGLAELEKEDGFGVFYFEIEKDYL